LQEARAAYDTQLRSFETEILHLADILHVIYEDGKSPFRVNDFKDLSLKTKDRIRRLKGKNAPVYEDQEKPWDGLSFVKTAETEVEQMNPTYGWEKDRLRARLGQMKDLIRELYGEFDYPAERRSLEKQLQFLEQEFERFDYQINPYQLQPGLTLDVDVTSIKRRRATLDAMSAAINEFLHGIARTFQEATFPSRASSSRGFGDMFSSVSASSLDLSDLDPQDYLEAPKPEAKPKKRKSTKRPPDPDDDDIREI
jgi:hypothetical protein